MPGTPEFPTYSTNPKAGPSTAVRRVQVILGPLNLWLTTLRVSSGDVWGGVSMKRIASGRR